MVSRKRITEALLELKAILAHESRETREMLEIYAKYWDGAPTSSELQKANRQFQELLKGMGLGVLIVLPFSPLTLPLLTQLAKKFGIDLLPSSFRRRKP